MNELETKLKEMIIENYGSMKKFCESIGMSWSTLDSILKRGVMNSNISNVISIASELCIDTESLAHGSIVPLGSRLPEPSLSPDEKRLVEYFRRLNTSGQEYIMQTISIALNSYPANSDSAIKRA